MIPRMVDGAYLDEIDAREREATPGAGRLGDRVMGESTCLRATDRLHDATDSLRALSAEAAIAAAIAREFRPVLLAAAQFARMWTRSRRSRQKFHRKRPRF